MRSRISIVMASTALISALGAGIASAAAPETVFRGNDGNLWTHTPNASLRQLTGSDPSAAQYGTGSYEIAFRGSNGDLFTTGTVPLRDWGYGIAAGTRPSIVRSPQGYTIAFNANSSHDLWTVSYNGSGYQARNWGILLPAGESPSVANAAGVVGVAFRNLSNDLEMVDSNNDVVPMAVPMTGTPSVTSVPTGFLVAGRSLSGALFTDSLIPSSAGPKPIPAQPGSPQVLNETVHSGTSPTIAALELGSAYDVEIAYAGASYGLNTWSSAGNVNWGVLVMPGTSPSIGFTDPTTGSFAVAFNTPVEKPGASTTYSLAMANETICATKGGTCVSGKSTNVTALGIAQTASPSMTVQ
jgi:hypothetical protein